MLVGNGNGGFCRQTCGRCGEREDATDSFGGGYDEDYFGDGGGEDEEDFGACACTEDGVAPDMITIAKGLGAGYQPIGALLTSAAIYDAIAAGTGFFQHGHTYMGHALAATAANAVLGEILDRDLLSHVTTQGDKLDAALKAQFGDHDNIGDIRGRGLFRGIELVADRSTKAPFDPSRGLAARIKKEAFAAGLICYPMSGTIDGQYGDHVLLAPPFIIEDAQIDELVSKLSTAIDKALAA